MTALITLGSSVILLGVVFFAVWKAAENSGRVKERNENLEKEIADAKKATQIMAAPARSWADVRASLRKRKPD